MSTNKEPLPTEAQEQAINIGVPVELSDEAIHNLTGYFDVLIQMDLAQKQSNERNEIDETDLRDTPKDTA